MCTQPTAAPLLPPLITFIVPCYNLERGLIRDCVESLLAIDLRPEERQILLVDDGSREDPMLSLKGLEQEVSCLHQPNRGLSAARNNALAHAQGRYIQLVDGDDCLIATCYNQLLGLLRSGKADIVFFRLTSCPTKKAHSIGNNPFMTGSHYLSTHNLRASACGYAFRRACLKGLSFAEGLLHEDELFTPQLVINADNVMETSLSAYFYRKRNGSITRCHTLRWTVRRLTDLRHIISTLHAIASRQKGEHREALNRRSSQLSMDYLYTTVLLTDSYHQLERNIQRLKQQGCYPLAAKSYTLKYTLFRLLLKNATGRRLLWLLIHFQR